MTPIYGVFRGTAGRAKPPTFYVYAYGKESHYTRHLVFEFDMEKLMTEDLGALEVMELLAIVAGGAAHVDEFVAVLARALHRSLGRLFDRPRLCPIQHKLSITAVRELADVVRRLTDTRGPLIFTEYHGEALEDA